jgi:hypothetical protein
MRIYSLLQLALRFCHALIQAHLAERLANRLNVGVVSKLDTVLTLVAQFLNRLFSESHQKKILAIGGFFVK